MKHPFSLDITELESLSQEMKELSNEEIEKVSGGVVTTQAVGEGGENPTFTTMAVGEEGGGYPIATTKVLGEEGGSIVHRKFPFPFPFKFPF